jgi:hypothetical protein
MTYGILNMTAKITLVFLFTLFISVPALAAENHPVRGHMKKNGTYVQPHRQTNANHTQRDNWSSKGNANPYTGKQGKKEPRK